jgi:hypothetical protein
MPRPYHLTLLADDRHRPVLPGAVSVSDISSRLQDLPYNLLFVAYPTGLHGMGIKIRLFIV